MNRLTITCNGGREHPHDLVEVEWPTVSGSPGPTQYLNADDEVAAYTHVDDDGVKETVLLRLSDTFTADLHGRCRFECPRCRRVVVATEANMQHIWDTLRRRGVSEVTLSGLEAILAL